MKHFWTILAAGALVFAACTEFKVDSSEILTDEEVETVIFEAPVIKSDDAPETDTPDTKAALVIHENELYYVWTWDDTLGVYPDTGSQVYFAMHEGVNNRNADFDGGAWGLRASSSYFSYYPFVGDIYLDKNAIPVSFLDQVQYGNNPEYNYDVRMIFASEETTSEQGTIVFHFEVLNSTIKLKALLPAGTYDKVEISTDEALFTATGQYGVNDRNIVGKTYTKTLSIDLDQFEVTDSKDTASVFFTCAPVDLTGKKVTVTFFDGDGNKYFCEKTPTRPYRAGYWQYLVCETAPSSDNIIAFKDSKTKALCVSAWDKDGDGELSAGEAAAVTSLGTTFKGSEIIFFDELQFFTGLTAIDGMAFSGCRQLTSITIPENVKSIGAEAFSGCISLEEIVIPDNVTGIGASAFYGCTGLSNVTIPASITSIGSSAFESCTGLLDITVLSTTPPAGGAKMFDNTNGCPISVPVEVLGTYKTADVWKDYADRMYDPAVTIVYTSANKRVVTPYKTDAFGANIVSNTVNSEGGGMIVFDGEVTQIGDYAFYNCSNLKSITIPATVKAIKTWAFAYCSNLSFITMLGTEPPTGGKNMFASTNCPIYVPAGTEDAYKAMTYWQDYASRIQSK